MGTLKKRKKKNQRDHRKATEIESGKPAVIAYYNKIKVDEFDKKFIQSRCTRRCPLVFFFVTDYYHQSFE